MTLLNGDVKQLTLKRELDVVVYYVEAIYCKVHLIELQVPSI